MDATQFSDALNNWLSTQKYGEDFWWEPSMCLSKEPTTITANVVEVSLLDCELGGEEKFAGGEGEIYIVFKVTVDGRDQYFKRTGHYESYVGSEWRDDLQEVKPVQKTITVFE